MNRTVVRFVGLALVGWPAAAGGAAQLWGDAMWLYSGVALALCLVPMIATLVWCQLAFAKSPESQLAAAMGGTGLRMVVVLAGAVLLYQTVPELNHPAFMFWVIGVYLTTLALEVVLLVNDLSSRG